MMRFRLRTLIVFFVVAVGLAFTARVYLEARRREPKDIGAPYRAIDATKVEKVELFASNVRDETGDLVATRSETVQGCLAAARSAHWSSETGAYRDSRLTFFVRQPNGTLSRIPFRINVDHARRDMGSAVADCIEDVRRHGKSEFTDAIAPLPAP